MKVILTTNIKKLGKVGDQIFVKDGFARNFLFPNNMALRNTKINLEHYEKILSLHGIEVGVRVARKHVSWYVSSLPGAPQFISRVNKASDPGFVVKQIRQFYKEVVEENIQ